MACLTESGIKRNDLTAALRRVGMEREFRAFGLNGKISWLIREPVADKVVARLDYEGGRISGLVLAGACKQRTIFFGVYGHAGASTDNQHAQRQAGLWSRLEELIKPNQELGHHVIVLGDFNVLPAATFTTSRKALRSSIEDFLTWQSTLGLSNMLRIFACAQLNGCLLLALNAFGCCQLWLTGPSLLRLLTAIVCCICSTYVCLPLAKYQHPR